MHRTLALASTLALSRAACVTDADCSLNGVCTGGSCLCDDGWTTYPSLKLDGPDCGQLDLLPAASDTSFHGLDTNKSSWGGSVLHLPVGGVKKKWTMFAAEMTRGCTLRHWTTNSEVVMATADDPQGPYTEAFQVIPPWAHNPEAILTPGGEVVVFTLGDGKPLLDRLQQKSLRQSDARRVKTSEEIEKEEHCTFKPDLSLSQLSAAV